MEGTDLKDFVIMTDSSCDLPASLAEKMELAVLPLSVYVEDIKYSNYLDEREISFHTIYDKLRTKCSAKTSAVNMAEFIEPSIPSPRAFPEAALPAPDLSNTIPSYPP